MRKSQIKNKVIVNSRKINKSSSSTKELKEESIERAKESDKNRKANKDILKGNKQDQGQREGRPRRETPATYYCDFNKPSTFFLPRWQLPSIQKIKAKI